MRVNRLAEHLPAAYHHPVKLLLTSAGVSNESIRAALADLLHRPFEGANLVLVTTAATAQPGHQDWLVSDINRVYALGWHEFNLLEINGLPRQMLLRRLHHADVIYVEGGNAYHLARSITDANLADDLRGLLDHKVYVGASAGSMIFTQQLTARLTTLYGADDELYQLNERRPVSPLNLFEWWLQPHVDFATWDPTSVQNLGYPLYAIDDQTAVRVVDQHVDVVSEGTGKFVNVIGTTSRPRATPLGSD